jgi:SAM-dependent methyltransferase
MTEALGLDDLLREALRHPVEGWDFGWLREQGRFEEGTVPWDYLEWVRRRARHSPDLLDLGTGGGERLSALVPHPSRTLATESYAPNVPVAARRLAPLGIQVIRTSGAPDNLEQRDSDPVRLLPFRDGAFHLVVDRNEAFVAPEVARILARGGMFLTEQTGCSEREEFRRLLDLPVPSSQGPQWDLELARRQVTAAGMTVVDSQEARFEMRFDDVGALVWYLLAVPWAAPGFRVERHRDRLEALHSRVSQEGPIRIPSHGFRLEARR